MKTYNVKNTKTQESKEMNKVEAMSLLLNGNYSFLKGLDGNEAYNALNNYDRNIYGKLDSLNSEFLGFGDFEITVK